MSSSTWKAERRNFAPAAAPSKRARLLLVTEKEAGNRSRKVEGDLWVDLLWNQKHVVKGKWYLQLDVPLSGGAWAMEHT